MQSPRPCGRKGRRFVCQVRLYQRETRHGAHGDSVAPQAPTLSRFRHLFPNCLCKIRTSIGILWPSSFGAVRHMCTTFDHQIAEWDASCVTTMTDMLFSAIVLFFCGVEFIGFVFMWLRTLVRIAGGAAACVSAPAGTLLSLTLPVTLGGPTRNLDIECVRRCYITTLQWELFLRPSPALSPHQATVFAIVRPQ